MNDTQINVSKEELRLIWDALSQLSENRGSNHWNGELKELPVLDALVEKIDALFVPQETN